MMIKIASEVVRSHGGISLSCELADDVTVGTDYALQPLLEDLAAKLTISKEGLKDHPTIRALRDFYWRIGIDPTKVRPSSEALARRFLTNRALPKINNVVDAGNIASIETLVPIGIYDAEMTAGSLMLRFAASGEEFLDISGQKRILQGNKKEVVLSDSQGIMHVFPYRDSWRTKVTDKTKKILVVGCGVPGIESGLTGRAVARTIDLIKTLGGASN